MSRVIVTDNPEVPRQGRAREGEKDEKDAFYERAPRNCARESIARIVELDRLRINPDREIRDFLK